MVYVYVSAGPHEGQKTLGCLGAGVIGVWELSDES